ncbi:MAG: hypothetical protein ABIH72_00025 [archaeon]
MIKKEIPIYAFFSSIILSFLGYVLKIIPCQTAPVVSLDHSIYSWNYCKFFPDMLGISQVFFGITSSVIAAFIISILFWFIIILIILSIYTKIFPEKKKRKRR